MTVCVCCAVRSCASISIKFGSTFNSAAHFFCCPYNIVTFSKHTAVFSCRKLSVKCVNTLYAHDEWAYLTARNAQFIPFVKIRDLPFGGSLNISFFFRSRFVPFRCCYL